MIIVWGEMETMSMTNVQGTEKEYCGDLKVPYFLLKNWFVLSMRISMDVCGRFGELGWSGEHTMFNTSSFKMAQKMQMVDGKS